MTLLARRGRQYLLSMTNAGGCQASYTYMHIAAQTHACMQSGGICIQRLKHTPSSTLTTVSVTNWVRGGVGHFSVYH